MLSRLIPLAAALLLAGTAVSGGDEIKENPKALLELFTSQGCASCPAADALLTELSGRPEVIALAYHVDYWDYVGWPDTFGDKENSDRQRDYASAWGSSRIFTPQLVVNGAKGIVASRKRDVQAALDGAALPLPVDLIADNGMLTIDIPGRDGLGEAVIWLVSYLDSADVRIEQGENRGKTIAYTQIVTGRQVLGMWDPEKGAQLKLPLAEVLADPANGCVILVQEEKAGLPGRILGAASFLR